MIKKSGDDLFMVRSKKYHASLVNDELKILVSEDHLAFSNWQC